MNYGPKISLALFLNIATGSELSNISHKSWIHKNCQILRTSRNHSLRLQVLDSVSFHVLQVSSNPTVLQVAANV